MNIGIDAGGTLIKVVCRDRGSLKYHKFPSIQLDYVASWINGFDEAQICVTGGKASLLKSKMKHKPAEIVEFEATSQGVRYFLTKNDFEEDAYLVTNVGTGTSIHHVTEHWQQRMGGTGVGGGTMMGLAQLLTGLTDYEEIVRLAAKGSRNRIDLLVSHIYEGAEPPIPGDLTASNFGNLLPSASLASLSKEELLAAVIGLVGETVATTSVLAAGQCGVSTVIFIGSSFLRNKLLKEVVIRYTKLRGGSPLFLQNGEFCGAVGASLYEV
ncbi:type II pantothenate kinase [Paenibacillus mendelii]|uniref:Type II pantothenate kinase n=1 Tax=Paenibacillus mendelii TaxID=206163 RepID=A0ABV6J9J4_9BACL|nr:type II pantothenate kinase [Paenibacillus mendelii]MCQ6561172.1 type II pantothenate kinase [Paenibacillus mendelii]